MNARGSGSALVVQIPGATMAVAALATLVGVDVLPGPRQYLFAIAAIGGAFAAMPWRSRFVDLADVFNLIGSAVLLLALGAYAVGFWPYFAETAQSAKRIGAGTTVALLGVCVAVAAARSDRGVSRVLASDSPAGHVARVLLPVPFVFPFLFSAINTWAIQRGFWDVSVGIWLFALANTVVFAVLTAWAAVLLYTSEVATKQAQRELESANENLETRVRDRTAELEKEIAARQAAIHDLERSNAELEQFAYIASHDLKSPFEPSTATLNSSSADTARDLTNKVESF